MFKTRPIVGITGPDIGGSGAWFFTAISVWLAGGKPTRITVQSPKDISELDGLIIGGGADVEPMKYGQQRIEKATLKKNSRTIFEWILSIIFFPIYWLARYFQHTKADPIDKERDELELNLLKGAIESRKPVLGICRGMQLMNVHFGGTLYQDISGFYVEQPQISSIFPKKRILIESDSKLIKILETDICNVNALHNQAIDKLGESLIIVAREKNTSVIQAVESKNYPFVIGVQWHPEYLIQIKRQRNIFKKLVQNATQNVV